MNVGRHCIASWYGLNSSESKSDTKFFTMIEYNGFDAADRGLYLIKIMKLLNAFCFSLLVLTGCGTPDPMLHTEDTKGRSGWTKKDEEQKKVSDESSSTKWKRIGTHEVEQK